MSDLVAVQRQQQLPIGTAVCVTVSAEHISVTACTACLALHIHKQTRLTQRILQALSHSIEMGTTHHTCKQQEQGGGTCLGHVGSDCHLKASFDSSSLLLQSSSLLTY